MNPRESYPTGSGRGRGRARCYLPIPAVQTGASSSVANSSEAEVNEDGPILEDFKPCLTRSRYPLHFRERNMNDVVTVSRNEKSSLKFLQPFKDAIGEAKYLLNVKMLDFVNETGRGAGAYVFEFCSEVREAIVRGEFGDVILFEKAGYTLLPVPESSVAGREAFFTLGVALANLINLSGYAVPGLSHYLLFALMFLQLNEMPPWFPDADFYAKIADHDVVEACEWLQTVIDTDCTEHLPEDILWKLTTGFQGSFEVKGEITKYRAMDLKMKLMYDHFIGSRIESMGYILEGFKATKMTMYVDISTNDQVFPKRSQLFHVLFLLSALEFPTECEWLRNLVTAYVQSIKGDQVALKKFWRMLTGEDCMYRGPEMVKFFPAKSDTVVFHICSRQVYIPKLTTPELFALVFVTDYKFDLPTGYIPG